jgi:hypothetical protein
MCSSSSPSVVRRRRQRKAAAAAVSQQQVDVLAGEILQPLVRGKLELDDRDVGRALSIDSTRHGSLRIWMSPGAANLLHLEHEVGQRLGAAEKREALALLVLRQRRRLVGAVVDVAFENPAFARAARAVAAAVRAASGRRPSPREHRVAVLAREGDAAGLYGNLVWHGDDVVWCCPAPCAGAKERALT